MEDKEGFLIIIFSFKIIGGINNIFWEICEVLSCFRNALKLVMCMVQWNSDKITIS